MRFMKGQGILKGLGVTLKHLIDTYLVDIKAGKDRYYTEDGVRQRMILKIFAARFFPASGWEKSAIIERNPPQKNKQRSP